MENRFFFATTLGYATLAAAIVSTSVMVHGNAYAESPTIDTHTFASTRSRDEVRAELMSGRSGVGFAEWRQQAAMARNTGGATRADVAATTRAAREEIRAFNSEDSGSSYLARRAVQDRRTAMLAHSGTQ